MQVKQKAQTNEKINNSSEPIFFRRIKNKEANRSLNETDKNDSTHSQVETVQIFIFIGSNSPIIKFKLNFSVCMRKKCAFRLFVSLVFHLANKILIHIK